MDTVLRYFSPLLLHHCNTYIQVEHQQLAIFSNHTVYFGEKEDDRKIQLRVHNRGNRKGGCFDKVFHNKVLVLDYSFLKTKHNNRKN
jgi:hypothetical protein